MKKAFTLVEMLIVVVIIGILSSALLPRLQGAQSSARDAARRSDLSQLWSAIISYYNNRWEYPTSGNVKNGVPIPIEYIWQDLINVVEMSSIPTDPNRNNAFTMSASWSTVIWSGQYWYVLVQKNSIPAWWFVLMARVETEWWANFLSWMSLSGDLTSIKVCQKFDGPSKASASAPDVNWTCTYNSKADLRYIYMF